MSLGFVGDSVEVVTHFTQVVYHTGSVPGFKTLVAFLPDDKLGIAVTFNTDLGPNTGSPNDEILTRVMSSVFGTRNEAPEFVPVKYFPMLLGLTIASYTQTGCRDILQRDKIYY